MAKVAFSTMLLTAIASLSWMAKPADAQLLYPPVSDDQQGLMVVGQGIASLPADTAVLDVYFVNYDPYGYTPYYDPYAIPPDGSMIPPVEPPPEPVPLDRLSLQPVVEALQALGIPASAIEITLDSEASTPYSYSSGGARMAITITQPTQSGVGDVVTAIQDAVEGSERVFLTDTYVNYSLESCNALEQAVYTAAVADARNRANAMAGALGVEIANVPSVAESPFNLVYPPCGEGPPSSPYNPFSFSTPTYYDPSVPPEVELRRDLFVTFPIVER